MESNWDLIPSPEESKRILEENLALREEEQPGFREQWEANRASDERDENDRYRAAYEDRRARILGINRLAKILSPGAASVFHECMKPVGQLEPVDPYLFEPPLLRLAEKYRMDYENHKKCTELASRKVVQVRDEWESIGNAAMKLRVLLKGLSLDARSELVMLNELAEKDMHGLEGKFSRDKIRHLFPSSPRAIDIEDSTWVVALGNLKTLSSDIVDKLTDVVTSGAKNDWEDSRVQSPEDILHKGILDLLIERKQSDRWLKPIARFVTAWAREISISDIPVNWGKESRTSARQEKQRVNEACYQLAKRSLILCLKILKPKLHRSGRVGKRISVHAST